MVFTINKPANSNNISYEDMVLPFQIEGADVMGRFIRSQDVIGEILERHNYPEPIARLLGEALLVTGMIGSGMKLRHRLLIQIQSDGAISMLIAEFRASGSMRGYVRFNQEMFDRWAGEGDINPFLLLGKGHIAMTVDDGENMTPYQGIVPLEGQSLSAVILRYIEQSDQILSSLKLHLEKVQITNEKSVWRGGAMMLQKLGRAGEDFKTILPDEEALETWQRACALFYTVQNAELIDADLSPDRLLYRLFHEDGIRIFPKTSISFACSCDAKRLKVILGNNSLEDLTHMAIDGIIHADCQFCNAHYDFPLSEFL